MGKLKAWIRFDVNKNVVPGSLILRESKPKVGTWLEVGYNLCCDYNPTPPPPPVPVSPLYIYDFQIECEDFCLTSIDINGEPYPFPVCEAPLNFEGLVNLLQTTFPEDLIDGVPAIFPAVGGTITIISSTRVFGTIITENCGSITPVVSGLSSLRFGFTGIGEEEFIKRYTETFNSFGQTYADASTVEAWNEYFDLPTNGTPFTNLYIAEQVYYLSGKKITYVELIFIGGGNMTLTGIINSGNLLFYILDDAGFVETVNKNSFPKHGILKQINLPACVLIGEGAFENCPSLTNINCPNVIEIQSYAFSQTPSSYLYFPLATDIGEGAFSKCPNLSVVNISSAQTLGDVVFNGSSSLTSLDMSSVTTLGQSYTCADGSSNNVFSAIVGQTITVKLPIALTTCNSGNPQSDLEELISSNTVTLITT